MSISDGRLALACADLRGQKLAGGFIEAETGSSLRITFRDFDSAEGFLVAQDAHGADIFAGAARDLREAIPCFTADSVISTAQGPCPIRDLRAGQRVMTRDSGLQELLWVGKRRFGWRALGLNPMLRPIRLSARDFTGAALARDLIVSPNHRIMLREQGDEWLAPAVSLMGRAGVSRYVAPKVAYYQLLTARHELLLVDECWSESYRATRTGLLSLEPEAQSELLAFLPELNTEPVREYVAREV